MNLKKIILAVTSLHMLAWLAMLVTLAGIIFLAVGVFGLLATVLPLWASALIIGGALLILVLLAILASVLLASRKRRKPPAAVPPRSTDQRIEDELSSIAGERATQWTKDNTGMAIAGALAAGVFLAANPRLRHTVYDAVRPLIRRKVQEAVRRASEDS